MLHSEKIDRELYFEAIGLAEYNCGGWTSKLKGIKPRTKWFKKEFCGNHVKADLKTINPN